MAHRGRVVAHRGRFVARSRRLDLGQRRRPETAKPLVSRWHVLCRAPRGEVPMAIGWQLIIRRADDAVLAPTTVCRRAFAACVSRVALGTATVAFQAPDGHAHVQLFGDRVRAGQLARALSIGLGQVLGHAGALEPVRLRPVHDQAHASHLFRYILDQQRHHGVATDPFHDASALPDLLGMRLGGGWMREVLAQRLPRVRRDLLVELLGVDPFSLVEVRADSLGAAAAAAIGAADLSGRSPQAVLARAAAAQVARSHLSAREVAAALHLPARTLQRLARCEVPPALLGAVLAQWTHRSWVLREAGGLTGPG
jgi:hypothetical protein